jgi:hypothetical protein
MFLTCRAACARRTLRLDFDFVQNINSIAVTLILILFSKKKNFQMHWQAKMANISLM